MTRLLPCVALLLLAAPVRAGGKAAPDFDKVIAPLLARRCLDCHSGQKPRGRLDLAARRRALAVIVPGKAEASALWQRVRDDEMPPKKPLPAAEKALLRAWIAGGARWGSDPIDPFRATTGERAGKDWWSLQPVATANLPAGRGPAWGRGPLDAFVLERLRAHGLSPSPEADRRTLVRRLSFDLLGLPPTPTEVEAFVADRRPDAYERLVDRLLASPHYGERWARHWLDVGRFGESDGFERDLPRPNAWPYRDWVVSALNADLPYDEFVRRQLAGDALRPDDFSARAATGFLVAGPHDIVVPASANMRETMRQDELEDLVGTVAQTFLGLTVHCARCHDHKFDPISQKDYYRLAAALSGVRHGERSFLAQADRARLAGLRARIEVLTGQLDALDEPARRRALAESRPGKGPGPRPLAEWDFQRDLNDLAGGLHATAQGTARRTRAGLVLDGRSAHVLTAPLKVDLTARTLEAWVRLDGLTQRGGGAMSVQALDGNVFDAIVFGEQEPGRWMAGSDGFRRTRSFGGAAEGVADRQAVHVALAYRADGTIAAYRNGLPYGQPYKSSGPVTFKAGLAQVVFGMRHGPAGGNKMLAGTILRARLHGRALTAGEIALSSGSAVSQAEIVARLSPGERLLRQALQAELARASAEANRCGALAPRKLYTVVPTQPAPTHLLRRGNAATPGDQVAPEALSALAPLGQAYRLAADAPEAQRRLALARWVTAPDNPLFARVMVNRLWHHHFGTGLVDTPNDFGFMGGRPSHPALLDWLAAELVRGGWSLKAIQRAIVLSATYRQSSLARPEAERLDAENRLLWRMSPHRLEAEAVRDAMLAAAGVLDETVGGPPFLDFRSYFFKGTQFYDPIDQVGPAFYRRTLYRMGARGGRSPFLDAFDCPDPSTTTPRRAVTTTPLQALSLLNNPFVLHVADAFAARVQREAGPDTKKQVLRTYRVAYGRAPEPMELKLARPFVARHGLAAFCRVVFNSNEFIQVD